MATTNKTNTDKGNTMNTAQVRALLNSNDSSELAGLNDWAVNTLREYARDNGYNLRAFACEETARLRGLDLDGYLTCSRIGSSFRLDRKIRLAVFAAAATRAKLETMGY
jgi:hypothetical protein